ncbi:hypothetical protein O181_027812, partial [Austropuccinia psidii MF-1]|nr:hypothetical protein [Austropuccinia psidii MF-1]
MKYITTLKASSKANKSGGLLRSAGTLNVLSSISLAGNWKPSPRAIGRDRVLCPLPALWPAPQPEARPCHAIWHWDHVPCKGRTAVACTLEASVGRTQRPLRDPSTAPDQIQRPYAQRVHPPDKKPTGPQRDSNSDTAESSHPRHSARTHCTSETGDERRVRTYTRMHRKCG